MILKAIVSILIAPIMLIGQFFNSNSELIYTRPKEVMPITQIDTNEVSTTTESVAEPLKNEVTKKEIATTSKKIVKKEEKVVETIKTPVITEPEKTPDFTIINTEARKTIVNILCTTKYNDLSPISGTCVLISSDGLILTNAHIAQYFLLKDFREKDYLKCIGRTGSPAYPKYDLELVYISQNWVRANKAILKEQNPLGTGEDDFAFLRIKNNIDGSSAEVKSYIQPNTRELITVSEPVLLASYPAGFLGGLSILRDLNITSAVTNIQDIFTFKDGTIDIVSVGGTVVSQKGSSGGLVVDKNTSLIGIITTSSDGSTTSSRGLNAITLAYINRALQREISMDLRRFLELDHKSYAENFNTNIGKEISKLIIDELNK